MKSHEELGLSKKEFNALLWVRYMLDTKQIEKERFDMRTACSNEVRSTGCGTIACIGGWTKIAMLGLKPNHTTGIFYLSKAEHDQVQKYVGFVGDDLDDESSPRQGLYDLFYPQATSNWFLITRRKASKAITNFLNTGSPQWEKVLKI